jgi:IstB-like ATP binding protein
MTDTPQLLLAHHLKALKLPTFLREYDKLARQCAAEGLDHIRFLLRLAELELIDRERRMVERRIKEARFPAVKSLDCFDFAAIPSLNKTLVLELARSEYVTRRENIIAVGNSGTGKTHVCLGLGLAACQKGLSVGFNTAAALVHELLEARDEKRLLRLQRQLAGCKLLIIDATWSHRYWTNIRPRKAAEIYQMANCCFRSSGSLGRRFFAGTRASLVTSVPVSIGPAKKSRSTQYRPEVIHGGTISISAEIVAVRLRKTLGSGRTDQTVSIARPKAQSSAAHVAKACVRP